MHYRFEKAVASAVAARPRFSERHVCTTLPNHEAQQTH